MNNGAILLFYLHLYLCYSFHRVNTAGGFTRLGSIVKYKNYCFYVVNHVCNDCFILQSSMWAV